MKIFIIGTNKSLQPDSQKIRFPKHNNDFGIEQDFLNFLKDHQELITTEQDNADWYYLPIFWTRWSLNNNYASSNIDILKKEIDKLVFPPEKTFTLCQYADGPAVDLGETIIFLASRKYKKGYDIPLLCKPHQTHESFFEGILKSINPFREKQFKKKYKASFRGRLNTHPLRAELYKEFKGSENLLINVKEISSKKFVKEILESEIILCPRGHGGNSFRFYEAMQLGVVPMLIGDIDTRPFKTQIDWDDCSFFLKSTEEVKDTINDVTSDKLSDMSFKAKDTYDKKLAYGKWCNLLIEELRLIKKNYFKKL